MGMTITCLVLKLRLPTTPVPQLPLLAFRMEDAMTVGSILDFRKGYKMEKHREEILDVTEENSLYFSRGGGGGGGKFVQKFANNFRKCKNPTLLNFKMYFSKYGDQLM